MTKGRLNYYWVIIQKSTLADWVNTVFRKAGIDTSQFKAHSCRSTATSKAKAMGISLEGVLKRGQWSGESTWQKHYHKPIQRNETFETAVLSITKVLKLKVNRSLVSNIIGIRLDYPKLYRTEIL